MTEVDRPTAVRRTVAFSEAVYEGRAEVEGVIAKLAHDAPTCRSIAEAGSVAVIVDPHARVRAELQPLVLVDAIVAKRNLGTSIDQAPVVIALGPGFVAGKDVHAVVETMRGHTLGRVILSEEALPDTGIPGEVGGHGSERVLRSETAGVFRAARNIGDIVAAGDVVGWVGETPVTASLDGVVRGLLRSGLQVTPGFKLGDIDARASREDCLLVSDKALAIAGGVLEAACMFLGGIRFLAQERWI
jgi:xanthine dehydrogenase accessory factor